MLSLNNLPSPCPPWPPPECTLPPIILPSATGPPSTMARDRPCRLSRHICTSIQPSQRQPLSRLPRLNTRTVRRSRRAPCSCPDALSSSVRPTATPVRVADPWPARPLLRGIHRAAPAILFIPFRRSSFPISECLSPVLGPVPIFTPGLSCSPFFFHTAIASHPGPVQSHASLPTASKRGSPFRFNPLEPQPYLVHSFHDCPSLSLRHVRISILASTRSETAQIFCSLPERFRGSRLCQMSTRLQSA